MSPRSHVPRTVRNSISLTSMEWVNDSSTESADRGEKIEPADVLAEADEADFILPRWAGTLVLI